MIENAPKSLSSRTFYRGPQATLRVALDAFLQLLKLDVSRLPGTQPSTGGLNFESIV